MIAKNLIIFILLITAFSPAFAAGPIVIDESLTKIPAGLYVEYLEDGPGKLQIEDIRSRQYESKWVRSDRESLGFGFTDSVYWIRFTIQNKTDNDI